MNVKEGQNIGYVSNDNIIHFEIWGNNQKLNPEKWLVDGNQSNTKWIMAKV